jgi:hypothetical protein
VVAAGLAGKRLSSERALAATARRPKLNDVQPSLKGDMQYDILVVNTATPLRRGFIAAVSTSRGGSSLPNKRRAGRRAESARGEHCRDCRGCFTLPAHRPLRAARRHGRHSSRRMRRADGFRRRASVRNGYVTALLKRFYERITYTLGFRCTWRNKHTLALSSVGIFGGKKIARNLLACRT